MQTVEITLHKGPRGRWRWVARQRDTGAVVAVSHVRGHDTRQQAVESVSSLLLANVEWADEDVIALMED